MDGITILQRLGQQLRAARTARGLTQAQVAECTGMLRLKVVQVEVGKDTVAGGLLRPRGRLGHDAFLCRCGICAAGAFFL